jgi:hypothetical protein
MYKAKKPRSKKPVRVDPPSIIVLRGFVSCMTHLRNALLSSPDANSDDASKRIEVTLQANALERARHAATTALQFYDDAQI